jgi:hypothetical protein
MATLYESQGCPKWHSCSAPACPLDSLWAKRTTQSDDPVCFYLSESVKDGAEARFERAGLGEMYRRIGEVAPKLVLASTRVGRALERARLSGSRMDRNFVHVTVVQRSDHGI